MKSSKELCGGIFTGNYVSVKDIHRKEFVYKIKDFKESGEPVSLNLFKSNTGGRTASDISFRVLNQSLFKSVIDSGIYIRPELAAIFNAVMSSELILKTIDLSDRENIRKVNSILSIIDNIELTEIDKSKTLRRGKGICDIVDFSEYDLGVQNLRERVNLILNRNHSYHIDSFALYDDKIELNVFFNYSFRKSIFSDYSKTPISIILNISEFNYDYFIDSIGSFVGDTIKNIENIYPDGSDELDLALRSIEMGKRTGFCKKDFNGLEISIF